MSSLAEANIRPGPVPKKDNNVSIEKERLRITHKGRPDDISITVEFDFLNHSNKDVVTLVAFPFPEYHLYSSTADHLNPEFDDFRLWVDDTERKCHPHFKAIHRGVDRNNMLLPLGINVATFGNYRVIDKDGNSLYQIPKLHQKDLHELRSQGLIKVILGASKPQWSVQKEYIWTQTFPAGKIVRIRCEYQARTGKTKLLRNAFESQEKRSIPDIDPGTLSGLCLEPQKLEKLKTHVQKNNSNLIKVDWVKYVLKSATDWKGPIRDFELVVETPERYGKKIYVSFCWDGLLERVGKTIYKAVEKDFVPDKDLTVYFIQEDSETPDRSE
jgi:hypothetical protein